MKSSYNSSPLPQHYSLLKLIELQNQENRLKNTWKGAFPVKHWKTIVPIDQRSAFASYCCDMITSGAMYIGEPQSVAAITPSERNLTMECMLFFGKMVSSLGNHSVFKAAVKILNDKSIFFKKKFNFYLANPKSASLMMISLKGGFGFLLGLQRRMFCGFRSLCTMPFLLIASRARAKFEIMRNFRTRPFMFIFAKVNLLLYFIRRVSAKNYWVVSRS